MFLKMNKSLRGFTLIQVVVALAVIGILAAIAFPSYKDAVRKGKRAEGRAALYQLMMQEERFYSQRNTYVAFSFSSTGEDQKQFKWFSGNKPATSAYEIKAEPCANDSIQNCVRLIAKPGTGNVDSHYEDPVCGELSFASTGEKSANTSDCWQ